MRLVQTAGVVVLAVSGLFCPGCSSVSATTRTYPDAPTFPPTDPSAVEILRSEPAVPYVRLGEITLSLQSNPSQQDIAQSLKQQAAQMGATAVLLVYDGSQAMGVMYSGPAWAPADPTQLGQVLIAIALRYT
jgi:hypothetical protein